MILILTNMGLCLVSYFFFNDTATTEIYTLSLHDALPIFALRRTDAVPSAHPRTRVRRTHGRAPGPLGRRSAEMRDRKSTRLNSSHANISYAVFCLKKKTSTTFRHCLAVMRQPLRCPMPYA